MTLNETIAILGVIKAAYPSFYKDIKASEANKIVELWTMMFTDDPAIIVTEAVKSLICTLKFPPSVADIREKITLITNPASKVEMSAWNEVLSAIQNSTYNSEETFSKLSPMIQRAIGSANQLKQWAMMDIDSVNSVVQSNFMRSYTAIVKRETEYASLPSTTKALIEQIRNSKIMIEGD